MQKDSTMSAEESSNFDVRTEQLPQGIVTIAGRDNYLRVEVPSPLSATIYLNWATYIEPVTGANMARPTEPEEAARTGPQDSLKIRGRRKGGSIAKQLYPLRRQPYDTEQVILLYVFRDEHKEEIRRGRLLLRKSAWELRHDKSTEIRNREEEQTWGGQQDD